MNWPNWVAWGFVATVVMTTLEAGGQGLRLTRVDMPLLIGTMWVAGRDRARRTGLFFHFVNGWLFALAYVALFRIWGEASWWRGALIGLGHSAFLLAVVMPSMPAFHRRMASAVSGPTPTRMLEPPGFLGLHYGVRTPLSILVSHVAYGVILGTFYRA